MKNNTLGTYITECRESKGISQRALALKANTTNSTISRIEADSVRPEPDTLRRIADALGADYVMMMALCGYVPTPSTPTQQKEPPQLSRQMDTPPDTIKNAPGDGDAAAEFGRKLFASHGDIAPEDYTQDDIDDIATVMRLVKRKKGEDEK